MNCPNCRVEVPMGTAFCTECGTPLGQPGAGGAAPPPGYIPPPGPAAPARSGGLGKVLLLVVGILLVVGAIVFVVPQLLDGGGASTPGLEPGKLDPSTPPVTFTQPSVNPMAGMALGQSLHQFQVENTSHCDISAVVFAAVLFDESGKRLPGAPQEVGLAGNAGDVHPGETYECKFTTGNASAARAAVVLKEVLYVFVPEGDGMELMRVPMKWTNRSFDAEVAAAAPR